jgi:hypothetical protein
MEIQLKLDDKKSTIFNFYSIVRKKFVVLQIFRIIFSEKQQI